MAGSRDPAPGERQRTAQKIVCPKSGAPHSGLLRMCAECGRHLLRATSFTASQLRKKGAGACKDCVEKRHVPEAQPSAGKSAADHAGTCVRVSDCNGHDSLVAASRPAKRSRPSADNAGTHTYGNASICASTKPLKQTHVSAAPSSPHSAPLSRKEAASQQGPIENELTTVARKKGVSQLVVGVGKGLAEGSIRPSELPEAAIQQHLVRTPLFKKKGLVPLLEHVHQMESVRTQQRGSTQRGKTAVCSRGGRGIPRAVRAHARRLATSRVWWSVLAARRLVLRGMLVRNPDTGPVSCQSEPVWCQFGPVSCRHRCAVCVCVCVCV